VLSHLAGIYYLTIPLVLWDLAVLNPILEKKFVVKLDFSFPTVLESRLLLSRASEEEEREELRADLGTESSP
jgi:hypothetical protein